MGDTYKTSWRPGLIKEKNSWVKQEIDRSERRNNLLTRAIHEKENQNWSQLYCQWAQYQEETSKMYSMVHYINLTWTVQKQDDACNDKQSNKKVELQNTDQVRWQKETNIESVNKFMDPRATASQIMLDYRQTSGYLGIEIAARWPKLKSPFT